MRLRLGERMSAIVLLLRSDGTELAGIANTLRANETSRGLKCVEFVCQNSSGPGGGVSELAEFSNLSRIHLRSSTKLVSGRVRCQDESLFDDDEPPSTILERVASSSSQTASLTAGL